MLGVGSKLVESPGPFLQEDEGVSGYEDVCGTYSWGWDGCWLGVEAVLEADWGGLIIFSPGILELASPFKMTSSFCECPAISGRGPSISEVPLYAAWLQALRLESALQPSEAAGGTMPC